MLPPRTCEEGSCGYQTASAPCPHLFLAPCRERWRDVINTVMQLFEKRSFGSLRRFGLSRYARAVRKQQGLANMPCPSQNAACMSVVSSPRDSQSPSVRSISAHAIELADAAELALISWVQSTSGSRLTTGDSRPPGYSRPLWPWSPGASSLNWQLRVPCALRWTCRDSCVLLWQHMSGFVAPQALYLVVSNCRRPPLAHISDGRRSDRAPQPAQAPAHSGGLALVGAHRGDDAERVLSSPRRKLRLSRTWWSRTSLRHQLRVLV